MGELVRLSAAPEAPDADVPPSAVAALMREARRRSGMCPWQFAREIDRRCDRPAGLLGSAVEMFERGALVPRADVFLAARAAGGQGLTEVIQASGA